MDQLNKIQGLITGQVSNAGQFLSQDSILSKVMRVVVAVICILIVIRLTKTIHKKYQKYASSNPWILNGTKIGNKRMMVLQDPSQENSITLGRSENREGGLEFTYTFWIYINDWNYKNGEWKHIMHKGNATSSPLRAPGIWLHPKENAMRVYMNTFKHINEYVDIHDLPIGKWFHVAVGVRQKNLDIYINGNMVKRHTLEGIPKQNYGDLYINEFRGFGGFLSRIRYHDYYISYRELDESLSYTPALSGCVDSTAVPPYFSPNWWANSK